MTIAFEGPQNFRPMLTRGEGGGVSGDKGVFDSDVIWLKYCRNGVYINQSIDQSDHAVASKKDRSYSRSWVKATDYSLKTSSASFAVT